MTHAAAILKTLRRPKLLVRAARIGLAEYDRSRDLRRVLPAVARAQGGAALDALIEAESEMEQTRSRGDLKYSVGRHVELLIALMAEARLTQRPV